jgi:hypothetical protein
LPKDKGGLGVKNLELFNLSLLSKWKWRLLSDEEASWTDLLRFRYGHFPTLLLGGAASNNRNKESIWWRDIIDTGKGLAEDWFRSNMSDAMLVTGETLGSGLSNGTRINHLRIYFQLSSRRRWFQTFQ